jgi:hypothetical protein
MDSIPQKTCSRCKQTRPLAEYYKNRARPDGVQTYCKPCSAMIDAARKLKAPPRPGPSSTRYAREIAERRAAHEQARQELRAAPVKTCRRCQQEKPKDSYTLDDRYDDGRYPWCFECRRVWRQGRKERQRELERAWSRKNINRAREHGRNHYARHKDKIAPKRRAYDQTRYHTDSEFRKRKDIQTAQKNRRRRALLYGAPAEHHTEQEWRELCAKYNHCCLRCGLQLPLSRDHIVPVTQGGSDAITNIQPLCKVCNSWKNNRTIDFRSEWET